MDAYIATALITKGEPRFIAASPVAEDQRGAAPLTPVILEPTSPVEDLVGSPLDDRISAWWDRLRTTLDQTTFFLLDPESWR